jgi:hypothetical protein
VPPPHRVEIVRTPIRFLDIVPKFVIYNVIVMCFDVPIDYIQSSVWDITPGSLGSRRFGGTYRFHLQGRGIS